MLASAREDGALRLLWRGNRARGQRRAHARAHDRAAAARCAAPCARATSRGAFGCARPSTRRRCRRSSRSWRCTSPHRPGALVRARRRRRLARPRHRIARPHARGQETLVAALVRAGATYYSDEYALIGADGRVRPYARDLSLRRARGPVRVDPKRLGRVGRTALPVGLVVLCRYGKRTASRRSRLGARCWRCSSRPSPRARKRRPRWSGSRASPRRRRSSPGRAAKRARSRARCSPAGTHLDHSLAMDNGAIGRRRWAIAEGYIPEGSHGPKPAMLSHETACLLNATAEEAHVTITRLLQESRAGRPVSRDRAAAAHAARALQRSARAGADSARDRLRERDRVGRADRRAAHAARLATGRRTRS